MAVRRAYTSTAAQIARFASEARVAKLLDEAVTMFNEAEGGDRDARLLAGPEWHAHSTLERTTGAGAQPSCHAFA